MKSILILAKLPLGQRPMLYVSRLESGSYVLAVMDHQAPPKTVSTTILRSLKQTVMLWNPQSGTHRMVHTDDIG